MVSRRTFGIMNDITHPKRNPLWMTKWYVNHKKLEKTPWTIKMATCNHQADSLLNICDKCLIHGVLLLMTLDIFPDIKHHQTTFLKQQHQTRPKVTQSGDYRYKHHEKYIIFNIWILLFIYFYIPISCVCSTL